MKYKVSFEVYENLKKCLSEVYPQVEVILLVKDDKLKELGFVDHAQCIIEVCATREQLEEIRQIGEDYEVNAFNRPDDPPYNDPDYQSYLKYGWLQDISSFEEVE